MAKSYISICVYVLGNSILSFIMMAMITFIITWLHVFLYHQEFSNKRIFAICMANLGLLIRYTKLSTKSGVLDYTWEHTTLVCFSLSFSKCVYNDLSYKYGSLSTTIVTTRMNMDFVWSTRYSYPLCSITPGPLFIPTFSGICMAERSLLKKELQELRWHLHWCYLALTSGYPYSLNGEYSECYHVIFLWLWDGFLQCAKLQAEYWRDGNIWEIQNPSPKVIRHVCK